MYFLYGHAEWVKIRDLMHTLKLWHFEVLCLASHYANQYPVLNFPFMHDEFV